MIPESLHNFVSDLDRYDWFCDAEVDSLGRFIVYVSRMDIPFISRTANSIAGYHVLFHFDRSQPSGPAIPEYEELIDEDIIEVYPFPSEDVDFLTAESIDIDKLTVELDRLEKLCGCNILQDIFYEVHDGKNAITNLSFKFPEVKDSLSRLYDEYGFDVIYNELDG